MLKSTLFALTLFGFSAHAEEPLVVSFDSATFVRCLDATKPGRHGTKLPSPLKRAPDIRPPAHVQTVFSQLVKAAGARLGVEPALLPYRGSGHAASVNQSGLIFLSDTLWRGPNPLPDDEMAAILAHEIAHLIHQDLARRDCEFTALLNDPSRSDSRQQTARMHARVQAGDHTLGIEMFKVNHAREYAADALGVQLLHKAGFHPSAMERMLIRIATPYNSQGSGTHPDTLSRIENVRQVVEELLNR